MSGLIGANNQFGQQFGHPDATMQGICETFDFLVGREIMADKKFSDFDL